MGKILAGLGMNLGLGMVLALPLGAQSPLERVTVSDVKAQNVTLDRVRGRATAVILANRDNADQAAALGQEIVFVLGSHKNFALMPIADLRGAPDFARGYVLDLIQDKSNKARNEMKERVTKAGRTYVQEYLIYVPDWTGALTAEFLKASPLPEYQVFDQDLNSLTRFDRERAARTQQQLRNHIHVFVLDKKGNVKAHYRDQGAANQAIATLQSLLTEAPKTP